MDIPNAASSPAKAKDPVCGMDVNPATARHKTLHKGKEYFFCCAGCLAKFQANPEKILSSPPKPMGVGSGVSRRSDLEVMPALTKPPAIRYAASRAAAKDTRAYVCPMCPEVRQIGPGPVSQVWHGAGSRIASAPRDQDASTPAPCIRRSCEPEPGSCPICGMALEPRTVTVEEDNPELRDMTRRFWISLALTAPLAG